MNIQKFSGAGVMQVLAHIERERPPSAKYGNERIDKARTAENYMLSRTKSLRPRYSHIVKEARITHEATTGRKPRSDAVTLCGLVVQLPHEYCDEHTRTETVNGKPKRYTYYTPKDARQARDFFTVVAVSTMKYFGVPTNTMISATVHLDETTPHMHLAWVPVVGGKLNAKAQITRNKLKAYHQAIDKTLRNNCPWYSGGLVSDEVSERLKSRDNMAMDEYRKVKRAVDEMQAKYDALARACKTMGLQIAEVKQRRDRGGR